jgi:transcriptional regulator with XRE-family HTH domain
LRLIGTTQSAIARLEAGAADPRLSTLQRYAAAVSVTLDATSNLERATLEATAKAVRDALVEGPSDALREVLQFLDDVDKLDADAVAEAVRHEPAGVGDRQWDALLASIAEYASRRAGIPVPGWASALGRFLNRCWFVVEDVLGRPAPALAVDAWRSAPPELANRGVFLDRQSLVSV